MQQQGLGQNLTQETRIIYLPQTKKAAGSSLKSQPLCVSLCVLENLQARLTLRAAWALVAG